MTIEIELRNKDKVKFTEVDVIRLDITERGLNGLDLERYIPFWDNVNIISFRNKATEDISRIYRDGIEIIDLSGKDVSE